MKPSVVTILLNWNNSDDTLACLAQLQHSDYPALIPLVIDNGSTDQSLEHIRSAYPDIPLIASPINRGFAGGINQGLQYAIAQRADYALLLNSDVTYTPDLISQLVAVAEADPTIGIVGPKVHQIDRPGYFTFYGFRILKSGIKLIGYADADQGQFDHTPIDALPGCAMLISRQVLEKVGLFDSKFFFYCEDIDYCLRVAAAGFQVVITPSALLKHELGGSTRSKTGRRQFLLASARVFLLRKYWQRFTAWQVILNELRETTHQLRWALQNRNLQAAIGYLYGLIYGLQ